jgi:hypothetical protein
MRLQTYLVEQKKTSSKSHVRLVKQDIEKQLLRVLDMIVLYFFASV